MTMREHILAALREQFERWDAMLVGVSPEQATARDQPDAWSLSDEVLHLWAWQQRSIARLEAAHADREPVFPAWTPGIDPDAEGHADAVNAWVITHYHDRSWPEVYQQWRTGYLRFMEVGSGITEADLLDASRYSWLNGYPAVWILLASYAHHQEHWDVRQLFTP